eukprot:TRINITY_DN4996_c0_g1_i1.p1 TRINITY_DN4996_c0_g1~~TRINITY_DN4996_c0_g1_i1.p1  ORF type:complete len:566 (+),score=223.50 TRINITY_DN4996_c0_g1_i1:59-1756(+)
MARVLRYDVERLPPVIRHDLAARGWVEFDEEKEENEQPTWNLWWKSARFTLSQLGSAHYPMQRLNHFPKSGEITKKDTLLRNLRRMRGVHGQVCDILPESFILPGEYVKFCQAFADARDEGRPNLWICKPSELSRGRKIFVFKDIGQLSYDCASVVQKYVDNPMLLSGYKFDLRVYVLVTSFQPLRVYIYRNFLVRFGTEKYDLSDLSNLHSHLTNTSLNKFAPNFDAEKEGIGEGCKWDAARFTEWLAAQGIVMGPIWERIETVVNLTLLSIAPFVPQNQACFELYGFDLLLDHHLKPWLLEVNFSPALQVDGAVDEKVKVPLVHDMFDTLNLSACLPADAAPAAPPKEAKRAKPTARQRLLSDVITSRKHGENAKAFGRRVEFVDKAAGAFDRCFPFNQATEKASQLLLSQAQNERDGATKAVVGEIKKRELAAIQDTRMIMKAVRGGHAAPEQPPAAPSPSTGSPSAPPKGAKRAPTASTPPASSVPSSLAGIQKRLEGNLPSMLPRRASGAGSFARQTHPIPPGVTKPRQRKPVGGGTPPTATTSTPTAGRPRNDALTTTG